MKRTLALLTLLIVVCFQAALGQYSPDTFYVFKKTTLSGTAESITIQQPTSSAKSIKVLSWWVHCSVACVANTKRDGAPPSGTALTVLQQDIDSPPSTVSAYYSSNAGNGTALGDYAITAGGSGLTVPYENLWVRGVDVSVAFLRSDATLTNIVVATNVGTATTAAAHGLSASDPFTVQDATVDTDLNGTYTIATTPSPTTLTFATTDVADATYTEATLKMKSDNGKNFTVETDVITGTVRTVIIFQEF